MKYAAITIIVLALTGCADTPKADLIVDRPVVFIPDDRFFRCPTVGSFPNPATLTDEDIAELLITLDTNNRVCKSSVNAIRNQLLQAKAQLEAKPEQ